jgi:hypothetical protein
VCACQSNAGCDDHNPCTDDACQSPGTPTAACVHVNNTAPCNDGNACTRNDACQAGICVGSADPACTTNHPPECGATSIELWPPNHKFMTVSIAGVTDPDGDSITTSIVGIIQDEPLSGRGDGNTCPDGKGVGTSRASVRAERSGTGDGRVYHVLFTASDGKGGQCTGSVRICVPHDQRPGHVCGDDALVIDSTGPCASR